MATPTHIFQNMPSATRLILATSPLADGHKVSVQYGWRGTPEEQAFLHDVQIGGV